MRVSQALGARGESQDARIASAVGPDVRRADAGDAGTSVRRSNAADGPTPPQAEGRQGLAAQPAARSRRTPGDDQRSTNRLLGRRPSGKALACGRAEFHHGLLASRPKRHGRSVAEDSSSGGLEEMPRPPETKSGETARDFHPSRPLAFPPKGPQIVKFDGPRSVSPPAASCHRVCDPKVVNPTTVRRGIQDFLSAGLSAF